MVEEPNAPRPGPVLNLVVLGIIVMALLALVQSVLTFDDWREYYEQQSPGENGSLAASYGLIYSLGMAVTSIALGVFASRSNRMSWGPRAALLIAAALLAGPLFHGLQSTR